MSNGQSNRDFLEEVFLSISAKVDQNHKDLIGEIGDLKVCINKKFIDLEMKIGQHDTYFTILGGVLAFTISGGYLIPWIVSLFSHH